jgi:hypothetical protein
MRDLLKALTWPGNLARRWQETRRRCGLLSCPGLRPFWRRRWRRRTGTFLQGVFYCTPACLETALIAQLARLHALAPSYPPPNRIPLGLLMVARGRLTYQQVAAALAAQQSARSERIGEWFERLGFATEQEVTSALGLQWGCPVASSLQAATSMALGPIPLAILEAFQMLPLHAVPATNTLFLAFGERVDHAALYAIEKILDCRTQPCVAGRKSVARALEHMRQQPRPSEVEFGVVRDVAEIGRISSSYVAKLGAEEVRLARVGSILWLRLKVRSSHVNLVFRMRGETQEVQSKFGLPLPARFSASPATLT